MSKALIQWEYNDVLNKESKEIKERKKESRSKGLSIQKSLFTSNTIHKNLLIDYKPKCEAFKSIKLLEENRECHNLEIGIYFLSKNTQKIVTVKCFIKLKISAHWDSWKREGFPGSVAKSPPDNAGGAAPVPGLGRSHVPCGN